MIVLFSLKTDNILIGGRTQGDAALSRPMVTYPRLTADMKFAPRFGASPKLLTSFATSHIHKRYTKFRTPYSTHQLKLNDERVYYFLQV